MCRGFEKLYELWQRNCNKRGFSHKTTRFMQIILLDNLFIVFIRKVFSKVFLILQDEVAVCYAEFCDVFRCRNYLRIRRKKNKNIRNSFTKIMGSQEALYDLGQYHKQKLIIWGSPYEFPLIQVSMYLMKIVNLNFTKKTKIQKL